MTRSLKVVDDKISWTETSDEIIVLNLETSKYLVVNNSGRILWHTLVSGTTDDELIKILRTEYELGETVAAEDVELFLAALVTHGLLEAAPR